MQPRAKIDVTIATKNNEETIERCIENIKKYIPYNKIIVVDGSSKDDTVQIAKRLGAQVYFEDGLLGKVRYIQAMLCSTEWIAVIDSDVFINENWWNEVSRFINNPNIGSINGWLKGSIIDVMPSYEHFTKFVTAKKIGGPIVLSGAKYHKLLSFSNTLIRREVILKSKNDLVNVDAGEDHIISKNVTKLGYKIANVPKILGLHYHSDPIKHCKMEFYRAGKSTVINRGRLRGLRRIFVSFIELSTNWIKYSFKSKRLTLHLYKFLLLLYSEMVKGIIDACVTYVRVKDSGNSVRNK